MRCAIVRGLEGRRPIRWPLILRGPRTAVRCVRQMLKRARAPQDDGSSARPTSERVEMHDELRKPDTSPSTHPIADDAAVEILRPPSYWPFVLPALIVVSGVIVFP